VCVRRRRRRRKVAGDFFCSPGLHFTSSMSSPICVLRVITGHFREESVSEFHLVSLCAMAQAMESTNTSFVTWTEGHFMNTAPPHTLTFLNCIEIIPLVQAVKDAGSDEAYSTAVLALAAQLGCMFGVLPPFPTYYRSQITRFCENLILIFPYNVYSRHQV
jgi:hypothetical protein